MSWKELPLSECKISYFIDVLHYIERNYTGLTHLNFLQHQNFLRHKVSSHYPNRLSSYAL